MHRFLNHDEIGAAAKPPLQSTLRERVQLHLWYHCRGVVGSLCGAFRPRGFRHFPHRGLRANVSGSGMPLSATGNSGTLLPGVVPATPHLILLERGRANKVFAFAGHTVACSLVDRDCMLGSSPMSTQCVVASTHQEEWPLNAT